MQGVAVGSLFGVGISKAVPVHPVRVKAAFPSTTSTGSSMAANAPKWAQKTVSLPPHPRGCHLVTSKILKEIGTELSDFKCGLAHLFIQHTSASLTINENCDPDVRDDLETFLNKIVPEGHSAPWKHTDEGKDDMPAHVKSSMLGCSLTIPITNGKLNMGTWQGIWLCEHRDYPTSRRIVVTLNALKAAASLIWSGEKKDNSLPLIRKKDMYNKSTKNNNLSSSILLDDNKANL
ncbi:hypothetical protein V2J09_017387 [Rumex salicifolius]